MFKDSKTNSEKESKQIVNAWRLYDVERRTLVHHRISTENFQPVQQNTRKLFLKRKETEEQNFLAVREHHQNFACKENCTTRIWMNYQKLSKIT